MSGPASRFLIGIDLGTTNSAVAYVDTQESNSANGACLLRTGRNCRTQRKEKVPQLPDSPDIRSFSIPQLTAPAEIQAHSLLPSFLYLPGDHELPEGALNLPWNTDPEEDTSPAAPPRDTRTTHSSYNSAVGVFARDQGARVPGRLVSSAKSWLAHGGVDRTAAILPWGGDLVEDALSPVQASAFFLEHIRKAWDHRFGGLKDDHGTPCLMAEQTVVLTVPASFDEAARELTVAAARQAGLPRVILLEEPLAAFYGWLSRRETSWSRTLHPNEAVLIVDVGGGTTDFSLIEVRQGKTLQRTAVGDHLLLGGDNMDMALARQVENEWGGKLGQREWSSLVHQCRQAKEQLLDANGPAVCRISVSSPGRSLVAGTKTAELSREQVGDILMDGFFPVVSPDTPPPARRTGLRQMGLPYVADPAITRHLATFLKTAANVTPADRVSPAGFSCPTHILFNGGSLLPEPVRQRLCQAVGRLIGAASVPELEADDLTRAVADGAAFYARVRRGEGTRVKGGIARAYFLEIGTPQGPRFMCIMPRDQQENEPVTPRDNVFTLATNQTVRFRLFSSSTRLGDQAGDLLEAPEGLSMLPHLHTIVRYGRQKQAQTEVSVEAVMNETGTLDICCATVDGHHTFPLRFNLRDSEGSSDGSIQTPVEKTVDHGVLTAAETTLARAFEHKRKLPTLFRDLEQDLDMPRAEWGAVLLRRLADVLIAGPDWRTKTPEHEARWLNLTGFLLRPGFGMPGDDARIAQVWKLWHAGPVFDGKIQGLNEWWILWRRLAGGLRQGHQQQIAGQLFKSVTGEGGTPIVDAPGADGQVLREQWRCLAALERMPVKRKTALLKKLTGQISPAAHYFWVIARLGARKLLHGPENCVVPAKQIAPVADYLLNLDLPEDPQARRLLGLALVSTCGVCGIRNLELPDPVRQTAAARLEAWNMSDLAAQLFTAETRTRAQEEVLLGDDLPMGLEIEAV